VAAAARGIILANMVAALDGIMRTLGDRGIDAFGRPWCL
jgi:hypothetical protein